MEYAKYHIISQNLVLIKKRKKETGCTFLMEPLLCPNWKLIYLHVWVCTQLLINDLVSSSMTEEPDITYTDSIHTHRTEMAPTRTVRSTRRPTMGTWSPFHFLFFFLIWRESRKEPIGSVKSSQTGFHEPNCALNNTANHLHKLAHAGLFRPHYCMSVNL